MKEEVLNIVKEKLQEIGREKNIKSLINCKDNTPVYGSKGFINSITLVLLVSEVEEEVEMKFGKQIILADERAMSQKFSPFRSVNSLADYIVKLLEEDE